MKRKLTLILVCAAVLISLCTFLCISASAETYSGNCGADGDNVQWTLDTDTGLLEITGTGTMADYSSGTTPWYSYKDSVISITIGDGVTGIGDSAFYDCTILQGVTIGDSVTSIGEYAFCGCASLTDVTIPESVTSIGRYTFSGCTKLTSVYITDIAKWCEISFDYFSANPVYYAHNLYLNGELVTDLVITEGVTSIGNYAFSGCTNLTNITIPDSVTSIGESAFYNCTSLQSITIPFVGATKDGTENTYFGYIFGAKKYSDHSKYVPVSLKKVVITGGKSIDSNAFYECMRIQNITIPDSVTSIGDNAFRYCKSITSITIGNGVTSIGKNAFDDCTGLKNVYITDLEQWCGIEFNGYFSNPFYFGTI